MALQYFEALVGIIGVMLFTVFSCHFGDLAGWPPAAPHEHHEHQLGSGVRVRGRVMSISCGALQRGAWGPS